MRIPQSKVDEIYRAADIVEVLGDYLQLKKRGQNYWALSPFRTEKTPSFSVSPAKQIFKDFSSGKGGGVVTFLMEVEGYTYVEALLHLAKKYGIEVELEAGGTEGPDRRASLQALCSWAERWFQEQLTGTEAGKAIGLSYFRERGFNPETIRAFGLGYSPEGWDALVSAAQKAQFNPEYLTELGLAVTKEDTGARYDRFRGRVIFPIYDPQGRAVGFAGRILKTDAKAAKYVNSPESLLYAKSQLLYGLHLAKQAIRNEGVAILVEGYTDLISLYQAGVHHVVASSGTALTEGQLKLLGRYCQRLIVVYDGDAPGTAATFRAIELALAAGFAVKALHLAGDADPDSFVKAHGGAAFRQHLEAEGLDPVQYVLQYTPAPAHESTPERQTRLAHRVAEVLAKLPDPLARQVYLRHAAGLLGVDEALLLPLVNQLSSQHYQRTTQAQRRSVVEQTTGEGPEEAPPQPPDPHAPPPLDTSHAAGYTQERELTRLLLLHYDRPVDPLVPQAQQQPLVAYLHQALTGVTFDHPVLESLRERIFGYHLAGQPLPLAEQLAQPGTPAALVVAELLAEPYNLSENWAKRHVDTPDKDADLKSVADQALGFYKTRRVKQLYRESLEAIKNAPPEAPEELTRLLKRHKVLEQLYREVHGQLGTVVPG